MKERTDKYTILHQYFGHSGFRPGQELLINAILAGRDCLGIMPTGGGKSLCYQVPALLLPGITVVISPLISLMEDQVSTLREAGVDAAYLNSSMEPEEFQQVYRGIRRHAYKLLYAAPERLAAEGFAALMRETEISLVAVDEAHCLSQWGQDFRPSYLKIAEFVESLLRRPVLAAFTATATAEVQADIARLLSLRDPAVAVTGFDRPNLYFDVRRPKDKLSALISLVEERTGKSGIVYCATRTKTEQVCQALNSRGIPATRYHAGLSDEERRQNQDDFQFDRKTVMAATNAFGMGIDKSNVGFVIHYNMPKSLEAYYQEAGRAGRDGEPAECILLYSAGDVTTAKYLIEHSGENQELTAEEQQAVRRRDYQRLSAMAGYCKTTDCLRGYILNYFGQTHPDTCGSCGNCRRAYVPTDITVPAQMILSCVRRVKDALGYEMGAALILKVLRGSRDQRVLQLGLDHLSTYGLMNRLSQETVRSYIEYLESAGYLTIDPKYTTLHLTESANQVLFRDRRVSMPVRTDPADALPEPQRLRQRREESSETDEGLLSELKTVRNDLAREKNVPAYVIFSNATLRDMAARLPHTPSEFLEVSGVGETKAARYGTIFLGAIAAYERER